MMPQKVKKRRNKSATTNAVLLNARFLSESRIFTDYTDYAGYCWVTQVLSYAKPMLQVTLPFEV